ncbi:MAG: FAD:protein FMN transferase [Lachnospiraceae bacterium]|nr:FAD:protein FMN transferase [Lachnospiraceae bacterium]
MSSFLKEKSPTKKLLTIMVVLLMTVLLSGCSKEKFYSNDFFAMDTWMSVQIPKCSTEEDTVEHLKNIEARIREIENSFSVTLQASDLYKLNNSSEETIEIVNNDFINALMEALCYEQLTNHTFSPRLYKISREWGFTTGSYNIPEEDILKKYLEEINASNISVDGNLVVRTPGIMIDFGAIAKGYAADEVVEYLKANNIPKAIINLGGNVYMLGSKDEEVGWIVGVNDPFADRLLGTIELSDACVVTSGNYERYFERDGKRYHHIIDSTTGSPSDSGLASVTIISADASYADALSTALFVMGVDKAIEFWRNNENFEFVLVTENKEVYYSELLKNGVFSFDQGIIEDGYVLKPVSKTTK